jgi:hypothetical protein
MYSISLARVVIKNPLLCNEYIVIQNLQNSIGRNRFGAKQLTIRFWDILFEIPMKIYSVEDKQTIGFRVRTGVHPCGRRLFENKTKFENCSKTKIEIVI